MFHRTRREGAFLARIEGLAETLAEASGMLAEKTALLGIAGQYEAAKKQLVDVQITLDQSNEQHARTTREIEHKVGLHKIQTEHDVKAARKEAELAVREEALTAERERFKSEMEFMQQRFEDEVKSQRVIVEQVLSRLPEFKQTHSTVEHIGVQPQAAPIKLEIEK